MPKAIVSNVWVIKRPDGSTDIEATLSTAAPLVEAGFHCLTEVYIRGDDGHHTGHTPERLAFTAMRDLGFAPDRVQPCFGIFGGAKPADYDQWRGEYPGWSDYPVEHTLS